jgi:hypothetical protein
MTKDKLIYKLRWYYFKWYITKQELFLYLNNIEEVYKKIGTEEPYSFI